MKTTQERRQHRRIELMIEVAFATPEAYVTEYTKNISKGGAFLKTDRLPDRNAVVELVIGLPGTDDKLKIMAKVVRSVTLSDPNRPGEHLYGVGFQFIEWDEASRRRFDFYYEKLADELAAK